MSNELAEMPTLPENGQWKHSDGCTYVTRATALSMGFTGVFLLKFRERNHPALGRQVTYLQQQFENTRPNGITTHYTYDLYSLDDLSLIRSARENATVTNGLAPIVNGYAPKTVRMKGRVCVQFVRAKPPKPIRIIPGDDDRIALPNAARKSGIPLATFHTWTRRKCPFTESILKTTKRPGKTCDVDCISQADYSAIVRGFEEAKSGRLVRNSGTYLAPTAAAYEFDISSTATPTSMILANRRHRGYENLGRAIRSIDGWYLSQGKGERKRLTNGKCYHEHDLALSFRRIRPAPPAIVSKPTPAPAVPAETDLDQFETIILEALGSKTMRAQELAEKAGYSFDHVRRFLPKKVKKGLLTKTKTGYRRGPAAPVMADAT